MALSIRLYITCWILPLSALTFCTLLAYVILNLMPFFLHVPSNVSTVCLIIELRSNVDISSLTDLGSSSLSVRILLVSLVSLSVSKSIIPIYLSSISGGIVPSWIASRYPLMEVSGDLKSCDIFDKNFCWNLSDSLSCEAM